MCIMITLKFFKGLTGIFVEYPMEMFLFILTNSKLCSDMFGWFKEHYCF